MPEDLAAERTSVRTAAGRRRKCGRDRPACSGIRRGGRGSRALGLLDGGGGTVAARCGRLARASPFLRRSCERTRPDGEPGCACRMALRAGARGELRAVGAACEAARASPGELDRTAGRAAARAAAGHLGRTLARTPEPP